MTGLDTTDAISFAFGLFNLLRLASYFPQMVAVASLDPTELCAFPGQNAFERFQGAPRWINKVTLRSIETFLEHDSIGYVDKVGPTPLLMIVSKPIDPPHNLDETGILC